MDFDQCAPFVLPLILPCQARVKAALARKDEQLSAAQAQAAQLAAQLRSTEAVLAAQQAELRLM